MEFQEKIMLYWSGKRNVSRVLLQGFDISYIMFQVKMFICPSVA